MSFSSDNFVFVDNEFEEGCGLLAPFLSAQLSLWLMFHFLEEVLVFACNFSGSCTSCGDSVFVWCLVLSWTSEGLDCRHAMSFLGPAFVD